MNIWLTHTRRPRHRTSPLNLEIMGRAEAVIALQAMLIPSVTELVKLLSALSSDDLSEVREDGARMMLCEHQAVDIVLGGPLAMQSRDMYGDCARIFTQKGLFAQYVATLKRVQWDALVLVLKEQGICFPGKAFRVRSAWLMNGPFTSQNFPQAVWMATLACG